MLSVGPTMVSQSSSDQRTPPWLAWFGTTAAAAAILMGSWQLANLLLGLLAGSYMGELEGIVRGSAGAGVVATIVTLPAARYMLRWARNSVLLAIVMIPAGAAGVWFWLPRVFLYANF